MIQTTFKKNEFNQFVAFEITGHAEYAEIGEDIVCAAVSTLAITTCNNIIEMADYKPIIDVEEDLGGFLYFETLSDINENQQQITQILLENLYRALTSVKEEYPDFVQVTLI